MDTIYTIGYTAFNINKFVAVLKKYNISCVIDVRSSPVSQYYPDYNKDVLERALKSSSIYYRNYIEEFGARQNNKRYYTKDGYLDFKKFTKSEAFQKGFRKITDSMEQGYIFALMCAEKDPINCHRNIMVASEFFRKGYEVKNIMPDGSFQTQPEIENRLLDMYFPNRNQLSLLGEILNDKELISQAYEKRNAEIGYKMEDE